MASDERKKTLLNVLSLGVGVQSSTAFLKSCLGELPRRLGICGIESHG